MALRVFPEYGEQYMRDRPLWWFFALGVLHALFVVVPVGWFVYYMADFAISSGHFDSALWNMFGAQLALMLVVCLYVFMIIHRSWLAWHLVNLVTFVNLLFLYWELLYVGYEIATNPLADWIGDPVAVFYVVHDFFWAACWTLIFLWWYRRRHMHGIRAGLFGRRRSKA
ncbi:MAG: hypothetical protein AAGK14_04020 [Verrucomicrobiota bacterium]